MTRAADLARAGWGQGWRAAWRPYCAGVDSPKAGVATFSDGTKKGRNHDVNAITAGAVIGAYTPVTKALWQARIGKYSPHASQGVPSPLTKLPAVTRVVYPFTTNIEMFEMYRNPWNRVRMGRILEDLDSLAGNIAFDHADDDNPDTLPPMLVTAAVERIHLTGPLVLDQDAVLKGQVVYTGRSSMDIMLDLMQGGLTKLEALFTFVGRDPVTNKAALINRLEPQTDAQRALFAERHAVAEARKANRAQTETASPTAGGSDEAAAWAASQLHEAHVMADMPGLASGDAVLLDRTSLCNTFTCQPQQRNMYGRIFGGFLMRRAYELAFATVHMFAGSTPRFVEVDKIEFKRPVDVGDLVTFRSRVLHTRPQPRGERGAVGAVFVEVHCIVSRPEQRSTFSSNTFNLTFHVDLRHDQPLKRVLPSTPEQAGLIRQFYVPVG